MSKGVLERYWNGPADLRKHKIVGGVFDEIRSDVKAGRVFPALRENEIHLYHEGGRVLLIRPRSARTHSKYDHGGGDGEISLGRLTTEKYQKIKERCRCHNSDFLKGRNQHRETWIVSRLFKRFSLWAKQADSDQPKLIDIEVRLRPNAGNSPQMVDLLFLEKGRLTFVEVKRQYDRRVRSQNEPEVVEQVRRYEETLSRNRDDVLSAYGKASRTLSPAFSLKGFEPPKEVFDRVPILMCRRDTEVGRDTWLRQHLCLSAEGKIDPCNLVVDGGAICEGVYGNNGHPPWCKNGLWEQLDLRNVFCKIDDLGGPPSVEEVGHGSGPPLIG